MKSNSLLKLKSSRNKILASVCALFLSFGVMYVADKSNFDAIKEEKSVILEMTNRTLNISFTPHNPNMVNNKKIFNAINQNDIDNISKIKGVKSVKAIDEGYNPLSGYAKVNSKSSYIELYGFDEKGNDRNKADIEMVYGRNINQNDIGKNVIVLNMETVNTLQIKDAKKIIGTGLEINGSVYEIIGVMNVVLSDKRDNSSELQYASLIPKSTSKEVVARANAKTTSYSALTIDLVEGANINAIESSVYNLLYENHKDIAGFYERDANYSLPKKLDPTISILDNYSRLSIYIAISIIVYALISLFRIYVLNTKKEEIEIEEDDIDLREINNAENENNYSFKNSIIESISIAIASFAFSYVLSSYYLSSMNISVLFNVSIISKILIIIVSTYLLFVKEKNKEIKE